MDIEKLTKSQIVLLTLFISFVTSIATGIVTVSLMQQAPPAIAQTVNRIIENTVETIATSTKGQAAAPVVTQEKTILVNDADLIAQAVKQISPSLVKIYAPDDQTQFLGLGLVTSASGTIISDVGGLGVRGSVLVVLQNGTKVLSFITTRDSGSGLVYLTPATSTPASVVWTPASQAVSDPALGELIIEIGGGSTAQIAQGIVTQVTPADKALGNPEIISTNVDPSSIQPGSVIIDINANVVGVSTSASRASSPSGFIPASAISVSNP